MHFDSVNPSVLMFLQPRDTFDNIHSGLGGVRENIIIRNQVYYVLRTGEKLVVEVTDSNGELPTLEESSR